MLALETLINDWYMKNGYCSNENNWFTIKTDFSYKNKTLTVFDHTGKTKCKSYTFQSNCTSEVMDKVTKHFSL